MTRKTVIRCRDFLKILGQTIKLMTLYKPEHPVPTSALQEGYANLKGIFKEMGWDEATFSLNDGRWYINDTVLSDTSHIPDVLVDLFRLQELRSVTFLKGVMLYELAALCELGVIPPSEEKDVAIIDYLKQKGVRHLNPSPLGSDETFKAPRGVQHLEEVESPIPSRRKSPQPRDHAASHHDGGEEEWGEAPMPPSTSAAPDAEPQKGNGLLSQLGDPNRGFGGFLKNLVERSVADPQDRAHIYAETLKTVKTAIEKRTKHLQVERNVILNERVRTERVIGEVADGRVTIDSEGRILSMDPVAEEIFGKRLSQLAGRPILECVDGDDRIATISEDLVTPKDESISKNIKVAGRARNLNTLRNSTAIVQDEQGRVVGTYGVMPHATKIKEAERREEEFISHVTHELKAPLSSICSALEILEGMSGGKLKKQEMKFLNISRRNSARLKTMIDEILDFSKIKAGELKTELASTDLLSILEEAVEGMQPWASSKEIQLELQSEKLDPGIKEVVADHGRVVQILTNLISNAIKNTPNNGRIVVGASAGEGDHEGCAVLSVQDSGTGISKEDQKKIFEKFQQVSIKGRRKDGVGLGLAIVKHLITAHSGSLWVESELGKGSTFRFTLQLAAQHAPIIGK